MGEAVSKKLDLYLEKVIAKMNLDEAQRLDVEREFRAHLDEAIREGMNKGLTEDQAETEAILAFGQPSLIARQFGVSHGYGWFVFERICFSYVLYVVLKIYSESRLLAISISLLFLYRCLWNKIEINGTLHIRRLFRRTINIPFEQIKRVTFEKGHLWGRRRLILAHTQGQIKISSRLRNFRCAALALDTLCPNAMDTKVAEYINRLKIRIKKETKTFKIGTTIYWMVVLALFLIGFFPLWNMEGISIFLPISLLLLFPGLVFQALRHTDRSKVGLSWILALISFIYVFILSLSVIISFPFYPQHISLGLFFIVSAALILVWWRGKRLYLPIILVSFIILFLLLKFIIVPPTWKGEVKTLCSMERIFWRGLWSKDKTFFSIVGTDSNEDQFQPQLLIATEKESHLIPLTKGSAEDWDFSPISKDDSILLFYNPPLGSKEVEKRASSEAYIYDQPKGLSQISNLPEKAYFRRHLSLYHALSPNDSYMLTPIMEIMDKVEKNWRLKPAFLNLKTGKVITFEGLYLGRLMGWINESTYEIIHETYDEKEKETSIEIWHLDIERGEKKCIAEYKLKGSIYFAELTENPYIPVRLIQNNQLALMNKYTGDISSSAVQNAEENLYSSSKMSWCSEKEYLACIVSTDKENEIVIISPDRIIKKIPVSLSEDIISISLSPDGSKILMTYKYLGRYIRLGRHILVSNLHFRMIDIVRDKVTEIESLNLIQTLYSWMIEMFGESYIHWSPDSRSVAYIIGSTTIKNNKAKNSFELHLAKYEDWAEKNL